MRGSIHSKRLDVGSKTYFFEVRETKAGDRYLLITETRLRDGTKTRNAITVFCNHLDKFYECLGDMTEKLG